MSKKVPLPSTAAVLHEKNKVGHRLVIVSGGKVSTGDWADDKHFAALREYIAVYEDQAGLKEGVYSISAVEHQVV